MPVPHEWRNDEAVVGGSRLAPYFDEQVRKDVASRTVNRHLRRKLAPLLVRSLAANVERCRWKRYCLLRGVYLVYSRVLAQCTIQPGLSDVYEEILLQARRTRSALRRPAPLPMGWRRGLAAGLAAWAGGVGWRRGLAARAGGEALTLRRALAAGQWQ